MLRIDFLGRGFGQDRTGQGGSCWVLSFGVRGILVLMLKQRNIFITTKSH